MVERSPEDLAKRRALRAERRQKQRLANIERAEKMHAARLVHEVNGGSVTAARTPSDGFHIGCSGWYYWHWKGQFYPADVPSSQWFSIYAQQFKTVELNAPFYSWPTIATVKTWLRQAEPSFVYTVKVCELITHVRRFDDTGTLVSDFGYIAELLGPQMGCFLFQLPPSVRYSDEMLHVILAQLEPRRRNVVEFRHKSWWNEDVFNAFEKTGTIFCSCSGPRLPDELVKTSDDIYVRFHGTHQWYRHDYSEAELMIWAERIRQCGAKTIWAYFNNDRDGHAIKNAKLLSELLVGQAQACVSCD
ncbi:DUF72 domain-containing protein [Ensifer sp. Root278]|uniref:DUF72 domain-containing protein n=1 Tax=unclassified Ensifer TaxID=2633371 RepID=UPI00070F34A2|nr:DUF72 domain-containing protein [Ensifer sp. Root278]KRD72546.1 hypothetical protein ASE60_21400 [Ensifer sp. Root278]